MSTKSKQELKGSINLNKSLKRTSNVKGQPISGSLEGTTQCKQELKDNTQYAGVQRKLHNVSRGLQKTTNVNMNYKRQPI